MDYIVELPPSQGYDAIYVCVDRLSKMAHFVATTSDVTAEKTVDLYLGNVFKHHASRITLCRIGGRSLFQVHSQTVRVIGHQGKSKYGVSPRIGWTDRANNQTLEQYIRIYCDYHQSNWSQLLPFAEFTYNNAVSSSTGKTPFFVNFGYHPRATLKVRTNQDDAYQNPAAESIVDHLKQVRTELRANLEQAQTAYKRKFDRTAKPAPTFQVGDLVWLNRKNIETNRPSPKLDAKRFSPFKITRVVGESKMAFELELPPQGRIHPVFHAHLLDPYHANKFEGRKQPTPGPPEIVDGVPEYEVEEILVSRIRWRKLWYFVDWKGY
jgi:hypothetical protein